MESTLLRSTS